MKKSIILYTSLTLKNFISILKKKIIINQIRQIDSLLFFQCENFCFLFPFLPNKFNLLSNVELKKQKKLQTNLQQVIKRKKKQ